MRVSYHRDPWRNITWKTGHGQVCRGKLTSCTKVWPKEPVDYLLQGPCHRISISRETGKLVSRLPLCLSWPPVRSGWQPFLGDIDALWRPRMANMLLLYSIHPGLQFWERLWQYYTIFSINFALLRWETLNLREVALGWLSSSVGERYGSRWQDLLFHGRQDPPCELGPKPLIVQQWADHLAEWRI